MHKTKKDVDAKVRVALNKLRSESERNLRGFRIAKLYYNINELATAEQYLCSYLSVKTDDADAHKLLGQIYVRLKKVDKALEAFQQSLQLNAKQPGVLTEVCKLLLEDKNLSCKKAKYWCDLAESEHVQNDTILALRLKLTKQDSCENDQTESLLQKEIAARPNYVQLRIYLVRYYMDQNQIFNAFQYVHQVEKLQKDEFINSNEWYNTVFLVLSKYEQLPTAKKDWDFWLLLISCLERQVQISFTLNNSAASTTGLIETINFLFNLDQYLYKFSQIHEMLCAQKEMVELLLHHYRGQFLLHTIALIFKRELMLNTQRWRETARIVLPLLLLAYQVEPRQNKEPWMKHCDEHGTRLIILWQREASFRCAQVGRTLLSYVNDRKTVDKEKFSQHNRSRCDLLDQIRQICSSGQWRRNIFAALFCNSDQKSKEQSSFLIKCPKFYEPVYELPSAADIERYEEDAQFLRPQSLQHAVYLCLCNDNLASVRARYFNGLSFSTQNLNVCSAESLNQLDIDSFMYAAAIQAKRSLEVEREAYENYHSGNSNVIGKPFMLPFVLLESQLCTDNQAQWWCTAYKVYKNLSNGTDLAELRGILQYGIQVIRGVNGPKFDMAIVFKIGQIFVERAKGNIKQGEKCLLDARAESTYKYGLKLLKMHRKGLLEAVPKYFTYAKFRDFEKDFTNAAEDAASYLAGRYFERAEFEDLIEELTGLQLPFASYWQAEAYRKLDQASKTPKQMKRLYKEKTGECLKQTLNFLKSPNADPNHRLNSIIHDEIRTLHQFNASHLNESGNYFSPQNNSTIYHDAEDDFQRKRIDTPPPLFGLGSSQRARRHDTMTSTASSKDADNTTESLIKQMSSTLILLKKEILENVKPELQRVNKEIVLMNEKITGLEQALKAASKSTNPPSRDEALNMLDDFYVIDDALQQQLYQQQQQQQQQQPQPQVPTSHVPPSRYNSGNSGLGGFVANNPLTEDQPRLQMPAPIQVQANAFNNPMIPQSANYPVNVYGHNQSNPYLMPIVPSPMAAPNDILLPTSTLQVNKSVGNQPIGNDPPANVVITNSDPLPNTNSISLQSQQHTTLSVTIPPHHLKANTAVSQNSDSRGSIMPTFNKNLAPADTTTKSTAQTVTSTPALGTIPAFSFKPQIITAATAASTIHSNEEQNRTTDSSCRDTSKSGTHRPTECRPLAEFKTATSTSDETVLHTREKAEEVIFCYRAILFHHMDKEWKERGIGDMKIVKDKEGTYRILMRNDHTHKICANHNLTSEILLTIPENETKGFIWAANDFADGLLRPEKYFVRFKTSEIAAKFQEAFVKARQEDSKSKNKPSMTNVQTNASAIPIIPTAASSAQASRSESTSSESNPSLTTTVESSKMPANTLSGVPNFRGGKTMTSIGISPTSIFPPTINSLSASPFASIFNNLNNFANPPVLTNATLHQSCNNATNDLLNRTTPTSLPDLIEVSTDEETEVILFEQRAKLMRYDKEASGWKEKCLGNIQLLQNKNDPNKLRLIMRREQTHKQCCNQPVYKNTVFKSVKNSQTTLSWAGQDFCGREPVAEMLTVRFKTPEICKQFHDIIIKAQNQMSADESAAFPLSSNKNGRKSENKSDVIDRNAKQEGFGDTFKPKPGSWICSVCYITNAADKVHCVACDLPKEKTLLLKGPTSSKTVPSVKATFNFGTGSNVAQLQSATTPNPFTFSKSDATTKPITITPATQNAVDKEKIVSAPENFGDQFKAKAGSWTCSSCYLVNNDGLVHCIACDAPRSGTILEEANSKNAPNIEQNFSFGVKVADDNEEQAKSNLDFTFGSGSVAATNAFTFPKPLATSSTLSSIDNVDASSSAPAASTSNTTETLFSNTTEASGESAPNPFSLSRKGFTFAFKPKSPGRSVRSPVKFGGGDADGGGDEDVESQYLEEEENNTHFTPVIPLPEKVEAKTGEEEEEILYIHRAKLYRFAEGEWKERGLGNVKILRHLVTKRLRVVMRRDQVLKICLNHALNEDLEYKRKDDKSWLFAVNDFSEEIMALQKFSLRFKNKKIAEDFMEAVIKALDGSALPVLETNCGSISTEKSVTRKPPASAFNISEENEKLANALKLPLEFFTAKPPCMGCRGCDADNFTFIASKDNEVFVSREDTKHCMLPMELPSLVLIKQNTLSSVVSAAATTKTPSTSINFKKKLVDTFIASENSTPKTNENVTFKTGGQEGQSSSNLFTTKSPFGDENKTMFSGSANNATFTIGNNTQSTSIFGGTGSGVQGASIFGQKSSLFDNNASVFGTKSIFAFSANNSSQIASNNSIFGSSFTSFTGFSPNKTGESGGYVFGNTASANAQSGGSLFGGFSTGTNSSTAETAKCMDLSKTATAAIDFATLAEKASKDAKNDSLLAKGNTKHAPGEFIGLVNQDAFANFDKIVKNQKSNGSNEKNIPGNTSNHSRNNISGDGDNENKINAENYDPHYEPIIALPDEIVVTTGEEEESKLFGERASLYRWDSTNKEWKERGVGELKILFHRDKGTYRMLMRREQIHKLVLNHRIGADFVFNNLSKNPKGFAWASMNYAESSEGVLEKLAIRFKNEKLAKQFSEQLKECIEACKKRNNEID